MTEADFGLTNDGANARLAEAVGQVATAVRSGESNRREALVQLSDLVYPIAGDDPDVLDATVREAVVRELNPVLEQAGFTAMVPWEF
ncbi:MAG: hypothetical protein ACJ735_01055 [Actinomycetes bacterium]